MYTYHLQHLIFDAAEMVGISRDLAYASVVLRSSNNVKFRLAWGTVLQSIKPIRCIALMRVLWWDLKLKSFAPGLRCSDMHSSQWSRFLFSLPLDWKRSRHFLMFLWASALCTFYNNPAPLNGSMQFHYCTLVTREPEQTTLLFWSAACGVTPHGLHTADRR